VRSISTQTKSMVKSDGEILGGEGVRVKKGAYVSGDGNKGSRGTEKVKKTEKKKIKKKENQGGEKASGRSKSGLPHN